MNTFIPTDENKISEYIYSTSIPGLYYLAHKEFHDNRGMYAELSRLPEIELEIGKAFSVKQVNLAVSNTNVARGFHAENWNKLVTALTGECFCSLADLRPDSTTFGKTQEFVMGNSKKSLKGSLFISAGIANSICVIEGPVNYLYCVDELYANRDPKFDTAISLFDNDLAVDWPIQQDQMILSNRDREAISLREKFPEMF